MRLFIIITFLLNVIISPSYGQGKDSTLPPKPFKGQLRINLDPEGNTWLRFTALNQTWSRYNESNPGTYVLGESKDNTTDIGLRRTRLQAFGQISLRTFVYFQFGLNNFNFLSAPAGNRKLQAFFHDALGEYQVIKMEKPMDNWLTFGAGLTIMSGLSRFSQPSVSSIATMDVPVFAQATVDQTDEFGRKFSAYARGQFRNLNFRFAISDPFPIQTNGQPLPKQGNNAVFSTTHHRQQLQGLLVYNILDREDNLMPGYMTGTYLGNKRILNVEIGGITQQDATITKDATGNMGYHPMNLWSIALFADLPLFNPEKKDCITAYLGYFSTDYGPGYLRFNGLMNPADSSITAGGKSSAGNAYPMFGSGHVIYGQAAYKFRNDLFGSFGTGGVFIAIQHGIYGRLSEAMDVYIAGINWFIQGHNSKMSLQFENRPTYENPTDLEQTGRASTITYQYQVFF